MQRFVGLLLAAAACGGGSGGSSGPATADGVVLMDGFDPGQAPAPGTGFQVVTPIVTNIAAGGSYEYCSWTNITTDKEVWLKSSQGLQTKTGHHTVVYYATTPQPAGTSRLCTDADMANFRFALGAGGEGVTEKNLLPGDLAVRIPKGVQIVINHHYLNASTQNIAQAQSAVNVYYVDPGAKIVETSSLALIDTAMVLPTGPGSIDINCKANNDYATWNMIPHMHNWGTHITVDHTSATSTKRLFDVMWDPGFAFHPPQLTEDPTQPYVIHKGDQLHVHCDYDNTTGKQLTFGPEMCVAYAQTVDTGNLGNLACDSGQWGPF